MASSRHHRRTNLAHRYLGVAAALIVALLAVTGLLLNHAEQLEFLERPVDSELLLDWYDLSPEEEPASFPAGAHWAVDLDRDLYVDARRVAVGETELIGAAALDDFLVLATHDSLLLVSAGGPASLIDRLQSESLPGALQRVGRGEDGRLRVETRDGIYRADRDLLSWQLVEPSEPVRWSAAAELPPEQREAVLASFRGEGLPIGRVIADLHSGRILGSSGYLLMDGAAVVLLVLTGTGFYNWRRARRYLYEQ